MLGAACKMAVATRLRARRPGAAVLRVGKPRDSPILPDFDDVVVFHTGDRPPAMVEPQRIKVGCDVRHTGGGRSSERGGCNRAPQSKPQRIMLGNITPGAVLRGRSIVIREEPDEERSLGFLG
jgi:hypothetical protein